MDWKLNHVATMHGARKWIKETDNLSPDLFNKIVGHQCDLIAGVSDYYEEHIDKNIDDKLMPRLMWKMLLREWNQTESDWDDISMDEL